MHRSPRSNPLLSARALAVLLAATSPALAAPVPTRFNAQGVLRDADGALQTRMADLTFRIYAAPSGGPALFEETRPAVPVVGGVFSVLVGDGNSGQGQPALDPYIFTANTDLWLGVTVQGDPAELPRFPLASSFFAFQAEHANSADRTTQADYAATAGNAASANTATSATTAMTATTATTAMAVAMGGVDAQALAPLCVGTGALADTAVTTAKLAPGAVTAVVLADGAVQPRHLDPAACAPGQVLKAGGADAGWACAEDRDTTYAAGPGLSLDAGVFEVAVDGITLDMLAANSVNSARVVNNSIIAEDLGEGAFAGSGGTLGTATTVARSDHRHATCPAGMTAVSGGNGARLCIVSAVLTTPNWSTAADHCWNTFGAQLCTVNQARIACSAGSFALNAGRWLGNRGGDNQAHWVNGTNCADIEGVQAQTTTTGMTGALCCITYSPG